MPADQFPVSTAHDMMDRRVMQPVLGIRDRTDGATDQSGELAALTRSLGDAKSTDSRYSLADRIVALTSVTESAKFDALSRLFTHPERGIRKVALKWAGERVDVDPTLKLEAMTRVINQATEAQYVADALFGVLHTVGLATEDRFATAKPYVTDLDPEVHQMAIAVLLKHPEIVNDAIFEKLCEVFERAANHEDPRIADHAAVALASTHGFYRANTALNAR